MNGKIDKSLFSVHEHALDSGRLCEKCGSPLVMKNGKHGPFLGCSRYPGCDYILALHQHDGHIVKELGVPCPECGHELVLRQGRYGMFIGCSDYPNCQHIERQEPEEETEISCPECRSGQLVERKSRYGKTFWACNSYPKCRFAVNFEPVSGHCEVCGFPLLVKKKLASGTKLLCADKSCQQEQKEEKPT